MATRPVLRAAGSAWELARFFLFVSFLAHRLTPSVPGDLQSVPWLLAASAGGLLLPVAWTLFALFPRRHAGFLPLLRLGKLFELATLLLLFATGTAAPASELPLIENSLAVVRRSALVFGLVAIVDAGFLVGLLRYRGAGKPMEPGAPGPAPGPESLPGYSETDLKEYH